MLPSRPSAGALLANLPRHRAAPASQFSSGSTPLRLVPERSTGALYIATHSRTEPPPDQIVSTEKQNILLRQFHAREEAKSRERQKRSSTEVAQSVEDQESQRCAKSARGASETSGGSGSGATKGC